MGWEDLGQLRLGGKASARKDWVKKRGERGRGGIHASIAHQKEGFRLFQTRPSAQAPQQNNGNRVRRGQPACGRKDRLTCAGRGGPVLGEKHCFCER